MKAISVREHGTVGPLVVVLHGGPGAPGSARGLAEALGDEFRVLEPLQRVRAASPLTVERHVEDLATVLPAPAALVGSSWGAMLALSFATLHPDLVRCIALVGCGTYDEVSRAEYHRAIRERLGQSGRREYDELTRRLRESGATERDELLTARTRLVMRAQSVDPIGALETDDLRRDLRGADETWDDVLRLQAEGVEPARFAAIRVPVLIIHGDADPHPGRATYDVLRQYVPQLELTELEGCGHDPWVERHARAPFLDTLKTWLHANAAAPISTFVERSVSEAEESTNAGGSRVRP